MENTGKLVTGVFAGIVIGAIAGVLLAPKKGTETQQDIRDKLSELKTKIEDLIVEGETITSKKIEELKLEIKDLEEKLKSEVLS